VPTYSDQYEESVSVLVDIARLYGFKGPQDIRATVEHWRGLGKDVGYMKVAKYKLAAFFAFHVDQPLPTPPFEAKDHPGTLVGGRCGRYIQIYLKRADPEQRLSFLQSLKQAKKGFPRPGKKDLEVAKERFIAHITDTTPVAYEEEQLVDSDQLPHVHRRTPTMLSKETLVGELQRTTRELFENVTFSPLERLQEFFPSTRANYTTNRENGGTLGYLLNTASSGVLKGLRYPGGLIDYHTKRGEEDEEMWQAGDVNPSWTEQTEVFDAFGTLWLRMLKLAAQESKNLASPVALPEALKIRIITKSQPHAQFVLRALWKKMHSVLRGHPTFHLLGEPVSEEYLLDRLGASLKELEGYLSGDYEGATDNLRSWVSETIANEVASCLHLFPVEHRLLLSQLTGHLFDTVTGQKPQTRGQLMGSVVSFPILCIANAAISRWAYELGSDKRRCLLRDTPLMVNGDDMQMRCTVKGRMAWSKIAGFAGLKESVGKTWYSRTLVEINSTMYLAGPEHFHGIQTLDKLGKVKIRPCPFVQVPYVNFGLLRGLKRSGGAVGLNDLADPKETVGARYRELLTHCPPHLKPKVHKMFIQYHADVLKLARVPWHIPEWLGGLGLTGYRDPTSLDLRIAHRILIGWAKRRPATVKPGEQSWVIWNLAEKRIPSPTAFTTDKDAAGVKLYENAVSRECLNLLFDSTVSLRTLIRRTGDEAVLALRKNEKLWRITTDLPSPLDPQTLKYRRSYATYQMKHQFGKVLESSSLTLD
jgi:hypothetical protein